MSDRGRAYSVLLVLTVVFSVAGAAAAVPWPYASRKCLLGYKAFCAFTPTSTAFCLVVAGLAWLIMKKEFSG